MLKEFFGCEISFNMVSQCTTTIAAFTTTTTTSGTITTTATRTTALGRKEQVKKTVITKFLGSEILKYGCLSNESYVFSQNLLASSNQ